MTPNDLKYGNDAQSFQDWAKEPNPYEDLMPKLSLTLPFANDSFEVLRELQYLTELTRASDLESKMPLFRKIDADMTGFLSGVFSRIGIEWKDEAFDYLISQISPLTVRLKDKYNRARPYQLAFYREIDLHPFASLSAGSASYPSGHTLNSGYILEVFSKIFEGAEIKLKKTWGVIAKSREALGLHYPSDNRFSAEILKKVMKHPHTEIAINTVFAMYDAKGGIK
tara:strand:+ start:2021 stop:2695 length:675 start_codon:yes stop_codon:yes gene_type:complete